LPFYENVTKAARVQAAKLDLARASARMKAALASSGILARPAPPKIPSRKLRACASLGARVVCPTSEVEGAVSPAA